MKYCSKCGKEIEDNASFCQYCGNDLTGSATCSSEEKNTLQLIAKIFMVIGCVAVGWAIIPLIWCIPMTVSYFNKVKNGEKASVGFKVCTLLFVNAIAGILMLCEDN